MKSQQTSATKKSFAKKRGPTDGGLSPDIDSPSLITNVEVLEALRARSNSFNKRFENRAWCREAVIEYLQSTRCTKINPKRMLELKGILMSPKKRNLATFSSNDDGALHDEDEDVTCSTGFCLTEAEAVQVINNVCTEPVEIHLMVEELHTRMTEMEQDSLLELIGEYIGSDGAASSTTNKAVKTESETVSASV
jgi:hypothetical protein